MVEMGKYLDATIVQAICDLVEKNPFRLALLTDDVGTLCVCRRMEQSWDRSFIVMTTMISHMKSTLEHDD